MRYFYLLEGQRFLGLIQPCLSTSWEKRSFAPCRVLFQELQSAALDFAQRHDLDADKLLLCRQAEDLHFDRHLWRYLAGEAFLVGAADIPDIQTAPDTLCCLLAPGRYQKGDVKRECFAPIEQVHFGSRDLVFGGGFYRPEQAGWNHLDDVDRLACYLCSLDPARWTVADLACHRDLDNDQDRAEELEFVRDWFGPLRDLYVRAKQEGYIVVCENIS